MKSYYEEKADMLKFGMCRAMNLVTIEPVDGEAEPDMPIITPGISIHTSFGGADINVLVNGKIIGELSNIQWYAPSELQRKIIAMSNYFDKSVAEEYPVVIVAKQTIFDRTAPFDVENVEMIVQCCNELGQSRYTRIKDVSTLWTVNGTSVDDIVMEEYIVLAAKCTSSYEGISPEYTEAHKN